MRMRGRGRAAAGPRLTAPSPPPSPAAGAGHQLVLELGEGSVVALHLARGADRGEELLGIFLAEDLAELAVHRLGEAGLLRRIARHDLVEIDDEPAARFARVEQLGLAVRQAE